MNSKPIRSLLVALCAAVLLLPLGAGAATSAFQPANITHSGADDGNLYQDPSSFIEGQTIKLTANFPSSDANQVVTIYKESPAGSNDYTSTGKTDEANKYGNAYVQYEVTGDQKIFARAGNGRVTEIDELKPEPLGSCAVSGSFYLTPGNPAEGQSVKLTANFPSSAANRTVTFLRQIGGGSFETVGSDEANRYGNAYLNDHEVADGAQTMYGLIPATNTCTPKKSFTPVVSEATLDSVEPAGSNDQDAVAKATFVPADQGAQAELQVKRINGSGWMTIETASQNSSGKVTFQIGDPLEVEHEYRAVSNGITTNNTILYAAPLLDRENGVPTVHFNSNDGESVNTRDDWFDGEFSMTSGANDQNKDFVIKQCDAFEPFEAEMKGRGNYSWSFSKKGFNLKFGDSEDLCSMGNSKKWALIANHYDRSLLRNSAANFVGKQMDFLEYTPKDVAVDLFVNGSYRGAYILSERVNMEGGRIDEEELKAEDDPTLCGDNNPDVTGSYLLEWDFRKGANFNFGANEHGWIGLKEPEDEDYCSKMGSWINNYVDNADRDIFDGPADSDDWLDRIDLASAVDYYIAMEFLKPVDGNMWASVYMYKPRDEKLNFGPLWDFDLAMGSADRAGNVVSPTGWYLRNPQNISARQHDLTWFNRWNEHPGFRAAVKQRWNEVDQDLNDVITYLRQQEGLIDESANENYTKWNHDSKISKYQVVKGSWGADVDYLVDWLDQRWLWMNSQLDNND